MEGKKSTRLPTTFSFQKFWRGVAAFCFSQTAASLVLLRCAVRSVFISCPSRHYHTQLSWDIRVYAPVRFFFFLLYIPVRVWPDFSVYTWSSDPHQYISCPFRRHRSRFECCTTVTSKQTLPKWNVWRDAGDRRIVYFMQTSCCDISASWRGTWQPYSHLASACTALCFSRLVTSLTGTAQMKASDICISSSHHGLCSALTELTNGVWSWRLWTNQTVGGGGGWGGGRAPSLSVFQFGRGFRNGMSSRSSTSKEISGTRLSSSSPVNSRSHPVVGCRQRPPFMALLFPYECH